VDQALLALYNEQPWYEQLYKRTKAANGRGFSKADAAKLGRMAETLLMGRNLSSADLAFCRHISGSGQPYLAKYRIQILSLLGHQEPEAPAQENAKPEVRQ
jgi:hypothetical protein